MRRRRLRLVAPSASAARPAAAASDSELVDAGSGARQFQHFCDDESTALSSTAGDRLDGPLVRGGLIVTFGGGDILITGRRILLDRSRFRIVSCASILAVAVLAVPVALFRPPPLEECPFPGLFEIRTLSAPAALSLLSTPLFWITTPFCWAADGIAQPAKSAAATTAAMIDRRMSLPSSSSALRLTRIRCAQP